ncbi:MAG: choice-of-anchor I domain-containing protein [Planctomycetota bacterium]|jgi:DNA-binding beta-propeller fold protein YncE
MRILALLLLAVPAAAQSLEVVGAYKAQGKVSTEIISVQGPTKRAVVSLRMHGVELLDLADPANPKLIVRHALIEEGEEVTSAAFHPSENLIAVAIRPKDRKQKGRALVLNATTGKVTHSIVAGYDPDHLAFHPKGHLLAIANEGELHWEENGRIESRPGSVTLFDLKKQSRRPVHLIPAGAGVQEDDRRSLERSVGPVPLTSDSQYEPEYLVFSPNSSFLYVTLQENNLVAAIQTEMGMVQRYIDLGKTRHLADRTEDGKIEFTEELIALREPDGIAILPNGLLVTADEGDTEPKASKTPAGLPCGGGRTLTVIDPRTGNILGDTGNQLDEAAHKAGVYPDKRSDSKGSEPENVAVFVAKGKTYAAVGLERANAVALVDLADPAKPKVLGAFPLAKGGIGPEGLAVHLRGEEIYIYSANEVSGDITVYRFKP